ncbi:MAG: DMT family transporter, partial [Pseudomonadota bacterium]
MDNRIIGALLIVIASAFFATAGLFVQFAEPETTSWVALFVGMTVGGAVILPLALARCGWSEVMKSRNRWLLISRGLISFAQVGTLFYALHSIPLTDALLFRETSPLWVPILSAIFLHEAMPRKLWVVLAVGFFGIALVLHPQLSEFSIGYVVAVLNGLLFAIQNLLTRHLNQQHEPQERILFYIYAVGIATSLGPAALTFTP